MTFSIVAVDLDAGEVGVATQSKFLAAGALVPWASSTMRRYPPMLIREKCGASGRATIRRMPSAAISRMTSPAKGCQCFMPACTRYAGIPAPSLSSASSAEHTSRVMRSSGVLPPTRSYRSRRWATASGDGVRPPRMCVKYGSTSSGRSGLP